jgi:hypothetical protein
MKFSIFGAALLCGAISSSVSAEITTYSDFIYWGEDVVASGKTVATETFNSYNGLYASPLTGSAGGINWSATAVGGLYCDGLNGWFSTNNPVAATFTFAPGVMSVGANIFGTEDSSFNIVQAKITVTLADGSSYVARSNGPTEFVGFISDGAAISSLTMNAVATAGSTSNVYVTANNMYFGVTVIPAPGAAALIGLAALVSRRRR